MGVLNNTESQNPVIYFSQNPQDENPVFQNTEKKPEN